MGGDLLVKLRLPKLLILDYHGKARLLAEKLLSAGFPLARSVNEQFDVLVADIDAPQAFPDKHRIIASHVQRGGRVVMYPHGANVLFGFDGVHPVELPFVQLVHGEGHKRVMEQFGFPNPIEVVGWSYSETAPFRPPDDVRDVLLAPIHPYAIEEHTPAEIVADNRRVFDEFIRLDCGKTVRYIGSPAANGLTTPDGYTPVAASLGLDHSDIDRADVVIADGTYAFLALARGKPTVMISDGDGLTNRPDGTLARAANRDSYADFVRYPLVVGDAPLPELIERACAGSPEIDEWKRLFVGGPLDVRRLARTLVLGPS